MDLKELGITVDDLEDPMKVQSVKDALTAGAARLSVNRISALVSAFRRWRRFAMARGWSSESSHPRPDVRIPAGGSDWWTYGCKWAVASAALVGGEPGLFPSHQTFPGPTVPVPTAGTYQHPSCRTPALGSFTIWCRGAAPWKAPTSCWLVFFYFRRCRV